MSKKHIGSSPDSFLKEEGTFDEAQALAIKEVVVWHLTEAMAKQSLSKARLAVMLKTSRSQVVRRQRQRRLRVRRRGRSGDRRESLNADLVEQGRRQRHRIFPYQSGEEK